MLTESAAFLTVLSVQDWEIPAEFSELPKFLKSISERESWKQTFYVSQHYSAVEFGLIFNSQDAWAGLQESNFCPICKQSPIELCHLVPQSRWHFFKA